MTITISCPHCGESLIILTWPGIAFASERLEECSSCGGDIDLLRAVSEALRKGKTQEEAQEGKNMVEPERTPEQPRPPSPMFTTCYGVCQGCGKEGTLYPMVNPINRLRPAVFFCADCYEGIYDKYPG